MPSLCLSSSSSIWTVYIWSMHIVHTEIVSISAWNLQYMTGATLQNHQNVSVVSCSLRSFLFFFSSICSYFQFSRACIITSTRADPTLYRSGSRRSRSPVSVIDGGQHLLFILKKCPTHSPWQNATHLRTRLKRKNTARTTASKRHKTTTAAAATTTTKICPRRIMKMKRAKK